MAVNLEAELKKCQAKNAKLLKVVGAAEDLYDNRLGWSEGGPCLCA